MQRYDRLPIDCHPFSVSRRPHVIVRQRGEQLLVVVGGGHSRDQHNAEFPVIDASWNYFTTHTKGGKRRIINEGRPAPYEANKVSAIKQFSENGLLTRFSEQEGVPMSSGDSLQYNEADHLFQENFAPDDILHYYLYRQVPQFYSQHAYGFDEYMQQTLERYKTQLLQSKNKAVWEKVDFSMESVYQTHRKHFGEFSNWSFMHLYTALEQTQDFKSSRTVVQKIARHCNAMRDEHLVNELFDHLGKGESMFSVGGLSHVYAIEEDLQGFGEAVPNNLASAKEPIRILDKYTVDTMDNEAYTRYLMELTRV